jgi:hypothetical protein
MLTMVTIVLSVGLLQVQLARAKDIFILTGDRITNANNSRETIRLGERLPVIALKKRFAKYKVRSTFHEDCNVCAYISRGKVGFSVDYGETGIIIAGITCDTGCADALGNTIGTSLRQAVGSQANCDAGDVITCKSRIFGLSYIVYGNQRCRLMVEEQKETSIPSCARIEGFKI